MSKTPSQLHYDPTKSVAYYKEREKEARTRYQVLIQRLADKIKSNPRSERGKLTITAQELDLFVALIKDAEAELKSAEALTNTALLLEPNHSSVSSSRARAGALPKVDEVPPCELDFIKLPDSIGNLNGAPVYDCSPDVYKPEEKK